jgi:leader peptidase (prepilin peptidase)/N-methyltransferase
MERRPFSRGWARTRPLQFLAVPGSDPQLLALHAACVFIFGLLCGSFINVVVWRVPRRFSIVLPGSHCPTCGTPIRWYDNIPLVSLLVLGRRCRTCGARISWRYFGIELLTGLLFLIVFLRFRYTGATLIYLVFVGLLLVATFTDIDHWIIPDGVSMGGLAFGLCVSILGPWLGAGYLPAAEWPHWGGAWWRGLANAALGAAAGWAILQSIAILGRLIFRREAMGGGDIVLMAMFGAFLGWQGVAATLLLACLIGVTVGGSLLIVDKMREHLRGGPLPPPPTDWPEDVDPSTPEGFRRAVEHFDLHCKERAVSTHLPFGPYLCAAAVLVLVLWPHVRSVLAALYGGPWMVAG